MSILSRFIRPPADSDAPLPKPLTAQEMARSQAVIELIFAGQNMAKHLSFPTDAGPECICGANLHNYPSPPNHHRLCPIARFNEAVELARKVAIQ